VYNSHVLVYVGKLLPTEITDHLHLLVDMAIVFVEIILGMSRVFAQIASDSLGLLWFDRTNAVWNQPGLDNVVIAFLRVAGGT